MILLFYAAAAVAIIATALAISRPHPVHALLYLIVSLLGVALAMLSLGAAFAAALEVLVYAGAIMVLFVFVVMLIDIGPATLKAERASLTPRHWLGPGLLAGLLLAQLVAGLTLTPEALVPTRGLDVKAVGIALYGPYLLAVELASFLLLAGLISAYHLGRRAEP